MPAMRSPFITMAAPMFSWASTLMASSTVCSGRTETTRLGLTLSSSATVFMSPPLHVGVVRAAAALRDDPDNVLLRILDVARLAVHAVLRVDLQPRSAAFRNEFVDPSWTVARLGAVVNGQVDRGRNGGVLEREVRGLVLLVVGVRHEHGGQAVESEDAVGFGYTI